MIRLFTLLLSTLILFSLTSVWSRSTPTFDDLNYCNPTTVKENFRIEKLQIGTWVSTSLATAKPVNTVPASLFGTAAQNFEFSLQGLPQTRDTFYWQIWIDLNQDMDFEDDGESLLKMATPRKQKAIGKLIFPSTSSNKLQVRVMLSRSKANNPCGTQAKTLDYFDFWLLGNCPEIDASKQLKVGRVLEDQITLLFSLPKNQLFQWQLEGQYEYLSRSGITTGDSLVLNNLIYSNNFTFRYRLQCGDFSWTSWSDTIALKTKYKPICTPIDTSQVAIDSIGYDHVVITVPPQENSTQFRFSLFSSQGKGDTASNFSSYGKIRVPLRLQGALYNFSGVRKFCTDGTSSEWAVVDLKFTTLIKSCPKPSLDSVTIKYPTTYGIALSYTGKEHTKVIWNYPSYYQQCSNKTDTTQRDLEVWYKNGERISVRLKGVCASGERSPFSDTLWFERPCVGTDTSRLFIRNVTDKSAWIGIGIGDFCSYGYSYYITTDTTLQDAQWIKFPIGSEDRITLQNLLPDTRYFIKISGQCHNAQKTIFFSGYKSFKTFPELNVCSPIDSSEIKFRYFSNIYLWVDVHSSKVSVKKELSIEDADGYQSPQSYSFYDYVSAHSISTDTRYLIRIKNNCGELESDWSEAVSYTVPKEFCPRMNSARLRFTGEKDRYTLSYVQNPELPISGPYMWRYRQTGYSKWLDTLISDSNFVEIPQSLAGKYLSFSVRPLGPSGCEDYSWSNEYSISVFPCSAPRENDFGLKSVTQNSATFFIHRDRLPANSRLSYRKSRVSDPQKTIDLALTDNEVTVKGLETNTEYDFTICNVCQIGPTLYQYCSLPKSIKTSKTNFQPEPILSLESTSVPTGMKLVPNPSTGAFSLELPLELESWATLSITNLNGQKIHNAQVQLFPGAKLPLDLSQHPQGVYLVHVRVGNQLYREKLVLIK